MSYPKSIRRPAILFLDLDGTLWASENVPQSAWKAIEQARKNGHLAVINTGRKRDNVPAFLMEKGFDGYCFGSGTDLIAKNKEIGEFHLDPQAVRELVSYMKENGIGYSLETRDTAYDDPIFTQGHQRYLENRKKSDRSRRVPLSKMPSCAWNELTKISFDTRDLKGLSRLANRLGFDTLVYRNQYNPAGGIGSRLKGELTDRRYTKGKAVDLFLQATGRKREDWTIIAFGDQENDVPMFEAADVAVCMGNGTDSALRAADIVTDSIDHDGLYKAFSSLGLLTRQIEPKKPKLRKAGRNG